MIFEFLQFLKLPETKFVELLFKNTFIGVLRVSEENHILRARVASKISDVTCFLTSNIKYFF